MLNGIDVSGWQTPQDVRSHWDPGQFCMIKATEGDNFKSDSLDALYSVIQAGSSSIIAKDKLYGFYHFARPDQSTADKEAAWFLRAVGHHKGYALFALDWEAQALSYDPFWALSWLRQVEEKTGSKPLFYISASEENSGKYATIRDAGYPLWVAHWGVKSPTVRCWRNWAMWQYTDRPLDKDQFNGDVKEWRDLAAGVMPITPKKWEISSATEDRIVLEKC